MSMLAGVPMLSMDLRSLTDTERRIIRRYLNFYNAHKILINHGAWSVLYAQTSIAAAIVENDKEKMIILADGYYLQDALNGESKDTWIMNLSDKTLNIAKATMVFAADCQPGKDGIIPPGGSGFIPA
jgi:hypothetical protein